MGVPIFDLDTKKTLTYLQVGIMLKNVVKDREWASRFILRNQHHSHSMVLGGFELIS